jgi:hypothetical protein
MSVLENQLQQLQVRYAAVEVERLGSGTHLITIGNVPLAQGWSQPATKVRFLVPWTASGPTTTCA